MKDAFQWLNARGPHLNLSRCTRRRQAGITLTFKYLALQSPLSILHCPLSITCCVVSETSVSQNERAPRGQSSTRQSLRAVD